MKLNITTIPIGNMSWIMNGMVLVGLFERREAILVAEKDLQLLKVYLLQGWQDLLETLNENAPKK